VTEIGFDLDMSMFEALPENWRRMLRLTDPTRMLFSLERLKALETASTSIGSPTAICQRTASNLATEILLTKRTRTVALNVSGVFQSKTSLAVRLVDHRSLSWAVWQCDALSLAISGRSVNEIFNGKIQLYSRVDCRSPNNRAN
jgi:hypothetical protein